MLLPIMMIAISCSGKCNASVAIDTRFETMEECLIAKDAFIQTYPEGIFGYRKFNDEDVKCIDLRGKEHAND